MSSTSGWSHSTNIVWSGAKLRAKGGLADAAHPSQPGDGDGLPDFPQPIEPKWPCEHARILPKVGLFVK